MRQKIIRYAALAAGQMHDTGSSEPTTEMRELADELKLSHNDIIKLAAELTIGQTTSS